MTKQLAGEDGHVVPTDNYKDDDEDQAPGLVDGMQFLYQRRLKLTLWFIAFMVIGVIGFLYVRFSAPPIVEGTVALIFRGIERHEYPSGKRFSVEDFRTPNVLSKALGDAGISKETIDIRTLATQLSVTPVVPGEIQARWKKQEKDGAKQDEYYPNEFIIDIQVDRLTKAQRLRLFDAIVQQYQERVKYEQKAALSFVNGVDDSYEKLATTYDFWDVPALFLDTYHSLNGPLSSLILESLQYQDPKYQLSFRDIASQLNTWYTIRLQALEALTYQGRLVKNRDIMLQRVQYRIEDIQIQILQKTQEAGEAERLLGLIDRPKALLAGQLSTEKGLPMVDISALDRLIKSDYVGPVVDRISKLQQETQSLEAEKSRLKKQLEWLPKASNVDLQNLPSGYKELIQTLSSELNAIIQNYNRLLDEYLTATITNLVTIKQSPIITREGYSSSLILAGIVIMSFFLAIFLVAVEHLFQKAKAQPIGVSRQAAGR